MVLTARLLDRIGKGVRGAPRDALVADIAAPEIRAAAFGLRQSLDTVGAFLGPLLAVGLMLLWANDFRAVFWVAVIPGFLAVALLLFGVREPERHVGQTRTNPIRHENLSRLSKAYWWVVGVGAVFTLARFSEAFLVLRAEQSGIAVAFVPLVMMVHLPYLQPFADINKCTSRLAANLPLFHANLCPLTFLDVPEQAYSRATLGVYEMTRVELLRDLFIWAYERSTQEYLAIKQDLA